MLWLKIQRSISTSEITPKCKLQHIKGTQDIYSAHGINFLLNVKGNVDHYSLWLHPPLWDNKRKAKKPPFYFRLILLFLTSILFGKLVTIIPLSREPFLAEKCFDKQLSFIPGRALEVKHSWEGKPAQLLRSLTELGGTNCSANRVGMPGICGISSFA